jgi:hypothetical protein
MRARVEVLFKGYRLQNDHRQQFQRPILHSSWLAEVRESFDGQDGQERWEGGWLAYSSDRGGPRLLEEMVEGFFEALHTQV